MRSKRSEHAEKVCCTAGRGLFIGDIAALIKYAGVLSSTSKLYNTRAQNQLYQDGLLGNLHEREEKSKEKKERKKRIILVKSGKNSKVR